MSEIKNMENELEPRLQQMLKAYGATPKRDPKAARRNQERFVAILGIIFEEQLAVKPSVESHPLPTWGSYLNQLRENFVNSIGRRLILIGFAVLTVLAMFLIGGLGITAYAASSSLPGDTLYSLKTTVENIRAELTVNSAAQARLYLEYAGRRLLEIQALIAEGRYNDVPQAARGFESDVQKALSAIESLSQADPTRAIQLNDEAPDILEGYGDFLAQMLTSVPEDVQPAIQSAIDAARSTASVLDVDDENDDESGPSGIPTIESTSTAISSSSLPSSTLTISPTSTAIVLILSTSTPPSLPVSSPNSSVVEGGDITCQGLLGAITVDNLYVPQGSTCALDGTIVKGTIKVETGASLTVRQITVFGNIQA